MKTGFIYLWYDRKHKRYYLGSHWGTEDDGYICSSDWMKKSYKRRPYDFKRRIIQRNILKRETLLEIEYQWLQLIKDDEIRVRYYNLSKKRIGGVNSWKHLSIRNIGNKYNFGKKHSDETKEKMRQKALGRKLSDETKQKMRKPKSDQAKQRMSQAAKQRAKDHPSNLNFHWVQK